MKILNQIINTFYIPFKKISRNRLYYAMRGYRILKNNKSVDRISEINNALASCELNIPQSYLSKFLMGYGFYSGQVVIRQYLLTRIMGTRLNQELLYFIGKKDGAVIFPLPKFMRNILENYNFKVAHFRSEVLWKCYLFAIFIYGVGRLFKVFLSNLIIKRNTSTQKKYAYFSDLDSNNVPKKNNNFKSHNVITWYLKSSAKHDDISAIRHNVMQSSSINLEGFEISPQVSPLPNLNNYFKVIKYLSWSCCAISIAFFDLLRGRWWHPLILNQTALSFHARILSVDSLAREYLFHNSSWIYRPLWTYDAELKRSRITLYFYSTNIENFKRSNHYATPVHYGYLTMSWPRYLVWDKYQMNFIKKCITHKAEIKIVGPIWFVDNSVKNIKLPSRSIVVFDVQPVRDSFYKLLCLNFLDTEYFVPNVANKFLIDIYQVLENQDFFMALKRKRNIGKLLHPAYRYQLEKIDRLPKFISFDPNISGSRVIEKSFAVISAPYTSTAHLAIKLGKPSVYYDPTRKLKKDDPAAHGIKILSCKKELQKWLKEIKAVD